MTSSDDHPYRRLPDRAFWSRSVAAGWDAHSLVADRAPLLRPDDRIMSAGSCFAANTIGFLEEAGFAYVRTEHVDDAASDRFGYGRYSAAYGNIYTARQLLQLLQRVRGTFKPTEDRWHGDDAVIDPFRPGLPYPAESDEEFDALTAAHLARTGEAIAAASVLIVTLGLTEAWTSAIDGAVFPACPGTIAGRFDPARHVFKNFGVAEVAQDLIALIGELRSVNPGLRIILTVSPVPLVATATDAHVLCATTYSKSVLRVACDEASRASADVLYFPAYEIITGPQAPDYFAPDRRTVNRAGIEAVMDALLANSKPPGVHRRSDQATDESDTATQLSHALVQAECEEMMTDANLVQNPSPAR
jgi:hypothetical protein